MYPIHWQCPGTHQTNTLCFPDISADTTRLLNPTETWLGTKPLAYKQGSWPLSEPGLDACDRHTLCDAVIVNNQVGYQPALNTASTLACCTHRVCCNAETRKKATKPLQQNLMQPSLLSTLVSVMNAACQWSGPYRMTTAMAAKPCQTFVPCKAHIALHAVHCIGCSSPRATPAASTARYGVTCPAIHARFWASQDQHHGGSAAHTRQAARLVMFPYMHASLRD